MSSYALVRQIRGFLVVLLESSKLLEGPFSVLLYLTGVKVARTTTWVERTSTRRAARSARTWGRAGRRRRGRSAGATSPPGRHCRSPARACPAGGSGGPRR